MQINSRQAEEFARTLFSEHFKDTEKEFVILHSKNVFKCSKLIAKNKKVDLEKIKIAAWLHDIGRVENEEKHAECSVKLSEEKFGKLDETIKDCILNHNSSASPKTEEGKIMQLADKLSLYTPEAFLIYARVDKKEAIEFYKKNYEKISKLLKNFKFD